MRPWGTGKTVLNFSGVEDTSAGLVRSAFEEADFERLRAIKAAWDPGNVFRFNFNIPPRDGPTGSDQAVPAT